MPGIFISYRRDDTADAAGRICDRLIHHFGPEQIFFDVDSIPYGADFVSVLERKVLACDVLLAVIGPRWLLASDDAGRRRLDNPDDFVRLEIAAALRMGIQVLPILVGSAAMPRITDLPGDLQSLARKQALSLHHVGYGQQIAALIAGIEKNRQAKVMNLRLKAEQASAAGQFRVALDSWQEALSIDPADVTLADNVRLATERIRVVQEQITELKSRAHLAMATNDFVNAIHLFEDARRLHPEDGECAPLIERLKIQLSQQQELERRLSTVEDLTARGKRLFDAGRYVQAQVVWGDALRFSDQNPQLIELIALAQQAMARKRSPDRLAQRRRSQVDAHLTSAERAFDEGRFEEAIDFCEMAVAIDSSDARPGALIERCRAALETRNIRQWLDQAQQLMEHADFTAAQELVDRCRELNPASTDVTSFARALQGAHIAAKKARERQRLIGDALEQARTRLKDGALDSALRSASEVLALDPDNAEAGHLRDEVERALEQRRREHKEAEERERRAQEEQAAHRAQASIDSARATFQRGERAEAIAALEGFDDRARVADAVARLRDAAMAIDTATNLIRSRDRSARATALDSLAAYPDEALVASALARLRGVDEKRRTAEDHAAAAAALVEAVTIQFERGDRAEAFTRLEQFTPPHSDVTATLVRLRARAAKIDERERQEREGKRAAEERKLKQAQERKSWEEAATIAIRQARGAFAEGRRDEAVTTLSRFARPELVAESLADLRQLATTVNSLENLIRTEPAVDDHGRMVRQSALTELAAVQPAELIASALAALRKFDADRSAEENRRSEEARAATAIGHANAQFNTGRYDDAVAQLEAYSPRTERITAALTGLQAKRRKIKDDLEREELRKKAEAAEAHATAAFVAGDIEEAMTELAAFRPPELVAQALDTLRRAASEIDTTRVTVTTGAPPARRAAITKLAEFERRDLLARSITELRRIDEDRTAQEARAEAERVAAAAQRASTAARTQFIGGEYEPAIRSLEGFQPGALVAPTLKELQSAHDAIQRARKAVANDTEAARLQAIEALTGFKPRELIDDAAKQLQQQHLKRKAEQDARREAERRAEVERKAAQERARRDAERRAQAEGVAGQAREVLAKGQADAALALLEGLEPPHPVTTELLEELRQTLRVREIAANAQQLLEAGQIVDAWTTLEEARRLRENDPVVLTLHREITRRHREERFRRVRKFAGRMLALAPIGIYGVGALLLIFGLVRMFFLPETKPSEPTATIGTTPTSVPPPVPAAMPVTIDALPWARFTITPVHSESRQASVKGETPVRLDLLPGEYTIDLENGGLTQPLKEKIVVAGIPLERVFQMPGFSSDQAVTKLLGAPR